MYGTNLDQVGPKKANLDQLGQLGRRFAMFCLLRKRTFGQLGPSWSSTLSHSVPCIPEFRGDRRVFSRFSNGASRGAANRAVSLEKRGKVVAPSGPPPEALIKEGSSQGTPHSVASLKWKSCRPPGPPPPKHSMRFVEGGKNTTITGKTKKLVEIITNK